MTYRFIEHPRPVGRGAYEEALGRMEERLISWPGVKAVYQIGSVSTPGVSDLDMVVVFDDEATCWFNPLEELSDEDRYLFIHSLYGTGVTHFREAQGFSFFHNFILRWGTDQLDPSAIPACDAERLLKAQVALEYLLKLYVSLVVQRVYGVFKVRSFLLHVKAVRYDLDFLGVSEGPLWELTRQFIAWRAGWFDARPDDRRLSEALDAFFEALRAFLMHHLANHRFYLPRLRRYRLARSMWLEPGTTLGFRHVGVTLPPALSRLGPAYLKIQNRLNRFHFTCPAEAPPPGVLARRVEQIDAMMRYNQRCLPHFAPLSSSLHLS